MNHTQIFEHGEINVLIAMLFPKNRDYLLQLREIFEVLGVLQHSRRPIAILLQSWRIPVEVVSLKGRWCLMLKKARQSKHGSHPTILRTVVRTKRIPKVTGGAQYWRKKSHAFSIESLLKDTTIKLRDLSVWRMQNTGFFVRMRMPQKPLRQRPEFVVALKQCLEMQDALWAETRQSLRPNTSRTSTTSTRRSTIRRRKTSIIVSIGKLDGGATQSHGETRRQRLHLQHRSGNNRNGRRVGAHGMQRHLRNGGVGFLEGIRVKSAGRCRRDTHSEGIRGSSSRPSVALQASFVLQNKCCHLVCHMCHPWLFSHAPSSMSNSSSVWRKSEERFRWSNLLSLLLFGGLNFSCQVGSVKGDPSGSLLENRSKKAYLEEWILAGDDSSDEQGLANFLALVQSTGNNGFIRDWSTCSTQTSVAAWYSFLGTYWAPG